MSLLVVVLFYGVPAALGKGKSTKELIVSGERKRVYYLFVPDQLSSETRVPLIVLLHGSNRTGDSLVEKWKDLADKEKLVLAAPDSKNPAVWSFGPDGPDFLRDVVEHVKSRYPIDSRRVYLFGHSGGAIFALLTSLMESEYFAAVAVHAGALRKQDAGYFEDAKRKIPVGLFVGNRDPLFPLEVVRSTRDMFSSREFPVKLVEIPNHDHWYYDKGPKINVEVWSFLKDHSLSADPRYEQYQFNN